MTDVRAPSLGERRVRWDFNPSGNALVDAIKATAASAIDECEGIKLRSDDPEVKRLAALAQTAFEEGAMWAVKAATANA